MLPGTEGLPTAGAGSSNLGLAGARHEPGCWKPEAGCSPRWRLMSTGTCIRFSAFHPARRRAAGVGGGM